MDNDLFAGQLAVVRKSFPGTTQVVLPGRHLMRVPHIEMTGEWSPATLRGLLVCDTWPDQRPHLLIGDELRRRGNEPANFSRQLIGDEAWFSYSFSAPYSPAHPALVPVIRGWLRRFDGRSD